MPSVLILENGTENGGVFIVENNELQSEVAKILKNEGRATQKPRKQPRKLVKKKDKVKDEISKPAKKEYLLVNRLFTRCDNLVYV